MKNEQNDGIAIVLANRYYLYGLLQHIFGNEPSPPLLEVVTSDHTRQSLQLWLNEEECELSDYLSLLSEVRVGLANDRDKLLEELNSEYTYLFIGPNALPAPPWESVYLNEERTIFQESTLRVRRAYLEYQFLPSNYPHEADDHLAMELDFMVHLSKLAQGLFEDQNYKAVKTILINQKKFLDEHLLVWIKSFTKEIQNSKTHFFYPQMATLTEKILFKDNDTLQEILGVM
ncbi:molecular chaperone TorD family protein [Desulfitobacterium sp. THU1]|uniref:TorD/DmsD family molecular chaperone n=1 Tax=Desulfitobacterium sp. THU1 TaxID=3138072 RepID=UPI00311DD6BF